MELLTTLGLTHVQYTRACTKSSPFGGRRACSTRALLVLWGEVLGQLKHDELQFAKWGIVRYHQEIIAEMPKSAVGVDYTPPPHNALEKNPGDRVQQATHRQTEGFKESRGQERQSKSKFKKTKTSCAYTSNGGGGKQTAAEL
jgi:hypothetical protein